MVDFVLHHTTAIQFFFVVVIFASTVGLNAYKKRHNNQLSKRTQAVVGFLLAQVVIFGGFVIGVLASH